jgi:pyridoxamine 5'-phosphate oxidase
VKGLIDLAIYLDVDAYIKFANENPISFLATVDNGQPRVRGFQLWYADETGLYYSSAAGKDIYKQLKTEPKVEVCFFNSKSKDLQQMRVEGTVEFLDDVEMKKKLLDARPFLKKAGLTPENPGLILIRIIKCKAYFWTFSTGNEPKKFISFA